MPGHIDPSAVRFDAAVERNHSAQSGRDCRADTRRAEIDLSNVRQRAERELHPAVTGRDRTGFSVKVDPAAAGFDGAQSERRLDARPHIVEFESQVLERGQNALGRTGGNYSMPNL